MAIEVLYKHEIKQMNELFSVIEADFEEPCKVQVYDYDNEIIEIEILVGGKRRKFQTVDRKTMQLKNSI